MIIVGITGGTGAGKTTALKTLENMGAAILDCDAVYHELLDSSDKLIHAIDSHFPGVVVDGKLNRKALGRIVFASGRSLAALNKIAYPIVTEAIKDKLGLEQESGRQITAIDAIGLIESGIAKICDITVFVTAPAETRALRIMRREGISLDYAMMRINSQKPDSFFKSSCDYTIVNNFEDEIQFKQYCTEFFENLLGGNQNG